MNCVELAEVAGIGILSGTFAGAVGQYVIGALRSRFNQDSSSFNQESGKKIPSVLHPAGYEKYLKNQADEYFKNALDNFLPSGVGSAYGPGCGH